MSGEATEVVVYSTDWCSYCLRARRLLQTKGIAFREIDVDATPGARAQMRALSSRTSVPQIFIGARHVGGFDDLKALDDAGGLDPLLADVARSP